MDPKEVLIKVDKGGNPEAVPSVVKIKPNQGVVWTGDHVDAFQIDFPPNETPFARRHFDQELSYSKWPVTVPSVVEKPWPYKITVAGRASDPEVIVEPPRKS
jgi:hypothetical protein